MTIGWIYKMSFSGFGKRINATKHNYQNKGSLKKSIRPPMNYSKCYYFLFILKNTELRG